MEKADCNEETYEMNEKETAGEGTRMRRVKARAEEGRLQKRRLEKMEEKEEADGREGVE